MSPFKFRRMVHGLGKKVLYYSHPLGISFIMADYLSPLKKPPAGGAAAATDWRDSPLKAPKYTISTKQTPLYGTFLGSHTLQKGGD